MKAKARDASDNPFTINPLAVNILPFQSATITVFFRPESQRPSKASSRLQTILIILWLNSHSGCFRVIQLYILHEKLKLWRKIVLQFLVCKLRPHWWVHRISTATVNTLQEIMCCTQGFTSNMDAMMNQGKLYDYIGQIEFGSGTDKFQFLLKGKAIESANCIRPSFLNFGDVATSKHVDQTIDLSNKKSPLPIHFKVLKACPSYSCNPSEGLIPPGKSLVVIVRFCPKV